jgi:hypothetical protein
MGVAEVGDFRRCAEANLILKGLCFQGEFVGRAGLEPATPCVSCKCATRLRQRPLRHQLYHS